MDIFFQIGLATTTKGWFQSRFLFSAPELQFLGALVFCGQRLVAISVNNELVVLMGCGDISHLFDKMKYILNAALVVTAMLVMSVPILFNHCKTSCNYVRFAQLFRELQKDEPIDNILSKAQMKRLKRSFEKYTMLLKRYTVVYLMISVVYNYFGLLLTGQYGVYETILMAFPGLTFYFLFGSIVNNVVAFQIMLFFVLCMYSGLQNCVSIVSIMTFDIIGKIFNFELNPYISGMTIDDYCTQFCKAVYIRMKIDIMKGVIVRMVELNNFDNVNVLLARVDSIYVETRNYNLSYWSKFLFLLWLTLSFIGSSLTVTVTTFELPHIVKYLILHEMCFIFLLHTFVSYMASSVNYAEFLINKSLERYLERQLHIYPRTLRRLRDTLRVIGTINI